MYFVDHVTYAYDSRYMTWYPFLKCFLRGKLYMNWDEDIFNFGL